MLSNFRNYTSYTQAEDIKRLQFICEAIQAHHNSSNGLKILDIGCGNGNIGYQLAHFGHTILSIDMSKETIEKASQLHAHPSITYKAIAIEDFNDNSIFNVIICSEVLEHLHQPSTVLNSIHKLLTDDGIAIVTVPNGNGPREMFVTRPMQYLMNKNNIISRLANKMKHTMGYKGVTIQSSSLELTHIQFFKYADLYSMVKKHHFIIKKLSVSNFIEKVFPFSILTKRVTYLQKLDCRVADLVPIKWCSGFMIIMQKK